MNKLYYTFKNYELVYMKHTKNKTKTDLQPIFILGLGRTGSKIYMQILNSHSELHIWGEMQLLNPWYRLLPNTDDTYNILKNEGLLGKIEKVDELIDYCFTGRLNGTFWKSQIKQFKKKEIKKKLSKTELEIDDVLHSLLQQTIENKKILYPGVKFPLHFYYAYILKAWFPRCKIIHIIRDPRAIYVSETNQQNKPNYPLNKSYKSIYDWGILWYVITQFTLAVDFHREFKSNHPRTYKLFRYEDVVSNPEIQIKKLCDFLKVNYRKNILDIKVVDSSFDENKQGFDTSRIHRWENIIKPHKQLILESLLDKKMKEMGYNI